MAFTLRKHSFLVELRVVLHSKIVTGAQTMDEQVENLKIILMLKRELQIPFLFLCGGQCGILRRIGGELGCCMYLCVHEHDGFATPVQPLLRDVKTMREVFSFDALSDFVAGLDVDRRTVALSRCGF